MERLNVNADPLKQNIQKFKLEVLTNLQLKKYTAGNAVIDGNFVK